MIRIFLFAMIPLLLSSFARAECSDQQIEEFSRSLRAKYSLIKQHENDQESLRNFFRSLPNSFSCYRAVFGYDEREEGPLYSVPMFKLFPLAKSSVPSKEYIKKLVSLSIGGRWQADNVSALSRSIHQELEERTDDVLEVLRGLLKADLFAFWRFVFDGPHPEKLALSKEAQVKVCAGGPVFCEVAKSAYDSAVAENPH